MQRQFGDSQAVTHNSKFVQLLTQKISGRLHSGRTTWLSVRQYIHFEGVYSVVLILKESPTNIG
jgi:hypothetical protein